MMIDYHFQIVWISLINNFQFRWRYRNGGKEGRFFNSVGETMFEGFSQKGRLFFFYDIWVHWVHFPFDQSIDGSIDRNECGALDGAGQKGIWSSICIILPPAWEYPWIRSLVNLPAVIFCSQCLTKSTIQVSKCVCALW